MSLPSLPQEIIDDIILCRLPAKAIGRCRCVSKSWLALLTEPHFIKTHLQHTQKNPTHSLLFTTVLHGLFSVPLSSAHQLLDEMPSSATKLISFHKPHRWIKLLASCDGLVLFSELNFLLGDLELWLMNPTTGVIRSVPLSPFRHDQRGDCTLYGLGYDEVKDDYKVVSLSTPEIYPYDHRVGTIFSVFSVKSGAWTRLIESSPYNRAVPLMSLLVFSDGCIHWLASHMTASYSSVIIALRLSDEKFFEVPLPKFDESRYVFHNLCVLGGRLCLFPVNKSKRTRVWVKNDQCWSTKFTIVEPEEGFLRPLCLLGEEQVVLIKGEKTSDEKLVTYDFKKETIKDIVVDGILNHFRIGLTYTESLVSPNGQHEARNEGQLPNVGE